MSEIKVLCKLLGLDTTTIDSVEVTIPISDVNINLINTCTYRKANYKHTKIGGKMDFRYKTNPWISEHWILFISIYNITFMITAYSINQVDIIMQTASNKGITIRHIIEK